MCPGMDQWPSTRATVTRPVAAATELIAARRQKTATTRPPSARLGMPASLVSASRCQRRSNAPVSGRSQSPFLTPDQRERQYRSRWSRSALPTTSLHPRESTQGLPGQPRSCTCTARPKYSGIDGSGRARTCEGTSWGGRPPRPSCRPGHDRAAARTRYLSAISYRLTADGSCQLTTSGVRLVLPTRPLASPRTGPGDSRPGRAAPGDGDRRVPTCETRRAGDS